MISIIMYNQQHWSSQSPSHRLLICHFIVHFCFYRFICVCILCIVYRIVFYLLPLGVINDDDYRILSEYFMQ